MSDVRIDRIEVRLRGGSVERARELAAALPRDLARGLAAEATEAAGAAGHRARLEAPAVRVPRGATAAEAAAAVTGAVARAVAPGGTGPGGRGGRR